MEPRGDRLFKAKGSEPQPGAAAAGDARAELQQLLKLPLAYVRSPDGFSSLAVSAGWLQVNHPGHRQGRWLPWKAGRRGSGQSG